MPEQKVNASEAPFASMGWASNGSTSSFSSSFMICCNSCKEGFYREGFDNIAHLQYCARDFTKNVCNCVRGFYWLKFKIWERTRKSEGAVRDLSLERGCRLNSKPTLLLVMVYYWTNTIFWRVSVPLKPTPWSVVFCSVVYTIHTHKHTSTLIFHENKNKKEFIPEVDDDFGKMKEQRKLKSS